MKIKSIIKIFITILLILFVAWFFTSGNVYAASAAAFIPGDDVGITPGDSGYTEPIPEQDYEGISVNSHIANDFEFLGLDAPATYATGNEKKVITIAEAVYKENGELKKQIVVYFYHPAYKNAALPDEKMQFTFKLSTQHYLINGEYIKQLLLKDYMSDMTDNIYEVAHYNGIKKFTFGSKLNKHLLSDSSSIVGKNTVIKVNLSKTGYLDGYPYNGRIDVAPTKLYQQEFQFISECSTTARSAEQTNTSICVGYDVNTVSVDGKAVKLRYKTKDVVDFKFVKSSRETEDTDIFYFFFNVTDDDTGIQWGKEKYITEVNLEYYEYQVNYYKYEKISSSSVIDRVVNNKVKYINSNGSVYKTLEFENWLGEFPTLPKEELTAIYQTQTVRPQAITLQYLENSAHNTWVSFAGGWYNTLKTTYLTLFNTKSTEASEYLNSSSNYSQSLIDGYNFGLVYGNPNGYTMISESSSSTNGLTSTTVDTREEWYAELVGIIDITYMENGETHYTKVSSTEVDNSGLQNPIPGEGDIWEDEQGEPEPSPKNENSPLYQLIEFINNIINKIKEFFGKIKSFFSSAKSVIIVSVIVVIAIALIITLFKVINFINTARVARGLKKYNKKE